VRAGKLQGERKRSIRRPHVSLRGRDVFQRRDSERRVGCRSGKTRVEFLEGRNAGIEYVARDYRARRSANLGDAIFECEYEIIPSYDINGVGLLYFAAYPIINDICATRHAGRSFATQYSTVHRDVFYYGNSDPDDTLLFRLHRWTADDDTVEMESSIGRKSDGNLIAQVVTRKVRVDRRNLSTSASSR
jgi:probable biosynthetic protein (TIGR04098 family)